MEKQNTAMMELIEFMETNSMSSKQNIYALAKQLLVKEKQEICEAFNQGACIGAENDGSMYYQETYNPTDNGSK